MVRQTEIVFISNTMEEIVMILVRFGMRRSIILSLSASWCIL